jgi:hypothetical protein
MMNRNKLQSNMNRCRMYISMHESALEEMVLRQEYNICHHIKSRIDRLNVHLKKMMKVKYLKTVKG